MGGHGWGLCGDGSDPRVTARGGGGGDIGCHVDGLHNHQLAAPNVPYTSILLPTTTGIDFLWPLLLEYPRRGIGIVDAVCMSHPANQSSSGLYNVTHEKGW